MSTFALYFASQLLTEAGWPRRLGIFKKSVGYDTWLVDSAYAQSIDWGAALGAGRPSLALQMIAEMYRDRDWGSDDAPDMKVFLESAPENWRTAASPQDAVPPPEFAEGAATLSVEQFQDRQMATAVEPLLCQALLWGLSNPDRFEDWYGSMVADNESTPPVDSDDDGVEVEDLYRSLEPETESMPPVRSFGLEVDNLPPLPKFLDDSEQVVHDYERDVGPLHEIPPRLLADAKALGWRV